MKHPKSQDLALYVSNLVTPEERQSLAGHLRECPACAAEVEALERSARRLRDWQFPAVVTAWPAWTRPALGWSIAAALMLGMGFALGRFSTPRTIDPPELRAEVERSVKASMTGDLRVALEEAQSQSQASLAALEARLAKASDEQAAQLVRNLAAAVQSVREEDRADVRVLVDGLRREHEGEIRRVRLDLETVAANAADQLRFAHFQLRQLTAASDHHQ